VKDHLREKLLAEILEKDEIHLSQDQWDVLSNFWDFYKTEIERSTFLLTGSAGTGKTFLIRILTTLLRKSGYKVILLAPTGRAAKVISRRTRRQAFTIHHHIYNVREDMNGQALFSLRNNKEATQTCYIIDEASMIGAQSDDFTTRNLLSDLMRFVFNTDEQRKLILVGDPVQLPPVGYADSPALDPILLQNELHLNVYHAHLTEVKRQHIDSGILENAISIRDVFQDDTGEIPALRPGRDVQVLDTSYEALETYMGYFQEGDPDRMVFITYSNYQASRVNQAIRKELWGNPQQLLIPSDLVMVVKNNYAWGDEKLLPFIANGEMGTIRYVHEESFEEKYGLKWIDVEIEFQTYRGGTMLVACKIVLDLLENKQPQVDAATMRSITHHRRAGYAGMPKKQLLQLMRSDPYINALQVKYGYAITGHKAQGGQWENVIIGFEPDYGNNYRSYIRWAYTVFTRAEDRLFLLNCPFIDF